MRFLCFLIFTFSVNIDIIIDISHFTQCLKLVCPMSKQAYQLVPGALTVVAAFITADGVIATALCEIFIPKLQPMRERPPLKYCYPLNCEMLNINRQ